MCGIALRFLHTADLCIDDNGEGDEHNDYILTDDVAGKTKMHRDTRIPYRGAKPTFFVKPAVKLAEYAQPTRAASQEHRREQRG